MGRGKKLYIRKARPKDFDTFARGHVYIDNPFKDNYNDLIVAIYKQAIDDIIHKGGEYAADARLFLKKNPYGLCVDFDDIINKLRGGEDETN